MTKDELQGKVDRLNRFTGADFSLDWANGRVKVEFNEGSRDITGRHTKKECGQILEGMMKMAEVMIFDLGYGRLTQKRRDILRHCGEEV